MLSNTQMNVVSWCCAAVVELSVKTRVVLDFTTEHKKSLDPY